MDPPDDARPRWPYYAAIVLFVAVLAFAVLGLVRSSTLAGAAPRKEVAVPSPTPTPRLTLASGPVATPQIPPPTPSGPTRPPSQTYLHPPPELLPTAVPPPDPATQPRL
jgi:hypothetical protein